MNGILADQYLTYTVPGTAVAVDFHLGGKPSYVEIINKGNASGKPARAVWTEDMPAASAFVAVDEGTSETAQTFETTNGITPSDELTEDDPHDTGSKTIPAPAGFTLGLLTGINAVANQGDVLYIIARVGVNYKA